MWFSWLIGREKQDNIPYIGYTEQYIDFAQETWLEIYVCTFESYMRTVRWALQEGGNNTDHTGIST